MPKVYYHDVASVYPSSELRSLPGASTYAARVLASTRTEDVVILPKETRLHLNWILDHYASVGLPNAQTILFGGYESLRQFPDHELCVSFFSEKVHAVRPDQRWLTSALDLHSKNNFIRVCNSLDIPVPQTTCFFGLHEYKHSRFRPKQFPVYVKKAFSFPGLGVFRCESAHALESVVSGLEFPFQIQASLPEETEFINVQYEIQKKRLIRGTITYQILNGNTHIGNSFPTRFDTGQIYQVTDELARWAQTIGIKGIFVFYVAVTPSGQVLPIECNPCWNGASYFSQVAEKSEVSEWESRNVDFSRRTFDGFSLGELTFDSKRKEGVIIIDWGCVGQGKLGVFVAGSPIVRQDYLVELKYRLR
jgi:hypothetical protein